LIDKIVVMPSKRKVGFSDVTGFRLANVIVLNHSELLIHLVIGLVTDAYKHKAILFSLPKSIKCYLHFGHCIRDSDLLRELVHGKFSFWVVSHIVSSKLPFIIMSRLEPSDH
jgi:hypothetical protein